MFKNFFNNKVLSSKNTGFDMESIQKSKNSSIKNIEISNHSFETFYKNGLINLEKFLKNNENKKENLKMATNDFGNALKIKKTRVEPYIYLSLIFYICKDKAQSEKYLNFARVIDPENLELKKIESIINF